MATIKDVADYAGVSMMTVSRVINNPKKVSPKSRAKVMAAIEALDYSPNMFARGMVTGKSKTIGVMYSNLKNWIYADQIKGIEEVAIQQAKWMEEGRISNDMMRAGVLIKDICSQNARSFFEL